MPQIDVDQLPDIDTTGKKKKPRKRHGPEVIKKAKEKYMKRMAKTRIATECQISRSTLNDWVAKYDWEAERDEIESRAREKYIEDRSTTMAETQNEVNDDHKEILRRLRTKLKELSREDKPDRDEMSNLSQLVATTREMVKLEREVLGLDMLSKAPAMKFPTGFNIFLKTTAGDFKFNPTQIDKGFEEQLALSLPNQNEEVYEGFEVDEQEYLDGIHEQIEEPDEDDAWG